MSYLNAQEKAEEAKALYAKVMAIMEGTDAEAKKGVPKMLEDVKKLQAEALQLKDIGEVGAQLAAQTIADKQNKDAPKSEQPEPAKKTGEFKDWGEFLDATHRACMGGNRDGRLRWFKDSQDLGRNLAVKDMAEGTGAGGGFLVPPEFDMTLRAVMGEESLVRPRATKIRMGRRQINIPVLDQTGTTTGIPHWFGGMRFYWAEEAEEKTETDASFRQIELVCHKLIGYTRASDELVDDSAISLGDFLSGPLGFAGGVAWNEDYTFFRGTGAGQPQGIVGAGGTINVARAAVGTPIQYVDLVNMLESFLPTGRGEWFLNQTCMSNLMTIQDPAGGYVWQPNAREGLPQTLFGMPVHFTEKLPTVGNTGDVILVDLRYYLIGDRQVTTIESTKFDRWRYDQTSWRVVHRVDGQEWLSAPLTLQDGTSTISPFVELAGKTT